MELTVNANNIINSLIPMFDDIQTRYEKIPRGAFIRDGSEYHRLYNEAHKAEQTFYLASDLLGMNINAIREAVLAARRWHTRTGWQKCLPDADANRLLACAIRQNDRETLTYSGKVRGNEYLLYMNRVISGWAKRSMEKA